MESNTAVETPRGNPTIVTNQSRQGDVLLMRAKPRKNKVAVPVAAENGRVVLAHGEVTGHHHSFAMADNVAMFREDGSGGGLFLHITEAPAALEHQEHSTIVHAPGQYRVIRQRQFQAGMAARVQD